MTINNKIVENLFGFWEFVGLCADKLILENYYHAINLFDSDWPNRVFNITDGISDTMSGEINALIQRMKRNSLPNMLTIGEHEAMANLLTSSGMRVLYRQKGMYLDLTNLAIFPSTYRRDDFIAVRNTYDCNLFATIASQAFRYRVDAKLIEKLTRIPSRLKLFLGKHEDAIVSCGMIFYDQNGNAGLHMIGTLPGYRGMGLGTKMTLNLIDKCIADKKALCVLHASEAGERVYSKIGFKTGASIATYTIDGEDVRYKWDEARSAQEAGKT